MERRIALLLASVATVPVLPYLWLESGDPEGTHLGQADAAKNTLPAPEFSQVALGMIDSPRRENPAIQSGHAPGIAELREAGNQPATNRTLEGPSLIPAVPAIQAPIDSTVLSLGSHEPSADRAGEEAGVQSSAVAPADVPAEMAVIDPLVEKAPPSGALPFDEALAVGAVAEPVASVIQLPVVGEPAAGPPSEAPAVVTQFAAMPVLPAVVDTPLIPVSADVWLSEGMAQSPFAMPAPAAEASIPATPDADEGLVVAAQIEPIEVAHPQVASVRMNITETVADVPLATASPPDMRHAPTMMVESIAVAEQTNALTPAAAPARLIPASLVIAHADRIDVLPAPNHDPKPVAKVTEQGTAAKLVPVAAVPRIEVPSPKFGHDEARLYQAAIQVSAPTGEASGAETQLGRVGTLEQALRYSYANNPRILAARASVRSADYAYPAARSTIGPRLDAFATLSYTRDREEVLPGTYQRSQGWTNTAGLILSQPLLTFGRTAAATGQALASVEFQRQSLRLAEDQVMLDTVSSYVGVLRDSGAVTIAGENVALLQKELDDARVRFKVRDITLADVNQVEARLALAQTILLDAKARLASQQSRFYSVVGIAPGELAPPSPLEVGVSTITDAYAVGDANSPLIMAAQAREKISRALLEAAKAERMPMVGLRGTADYGSISDYSNDLRATRLRGQVTVSVPLFGGGRSAEIGRAEEANVADWRLMEAASRDTRSEIATGWNNLIAARRNVDHFRAAVQASQAAYEGAKRQEQAGMRTTLELLDLTRDLLDVRNQYNEALANEFLARAALLSAMGVLEADKLVPGLDLYDPATHFAKVRGQGDIPLLTGALASLDGVVVGNLGADRPNQDPAALAGIGQFEDDP